MEFTSCSLSDGPGAKKECRNLLAVLGTVDMLEMSQDRQCADERTRTQAGADLDRDTRCPPATTRRHTTRPYHDGVVSWCVLTRQVK